jgi:hypothetical protein
MLLDLIAPLSAESGYKFKDMPIVLHDQAFADDLSVTTRTPEMNQRTIDWISRFLKWAYLQANPKKCITMAMKRFTAPSDYERYGDTQYCAYDPALTISGEPLKFIVNVAKDPASLEYDHFKELGRFISVDLKETKIKAEISRRLNADMNLVETSGVNGLCKLFIYEHFVVPRLSWVFLIHNLTLFFVRELDKYVISRLKRWAGLYRNTDVGALFRKRQDLGLQLTSLEFHYQRMQLTKCCLLENSQDDNVRKIYDHFKAYNLEYQKKWTGPKELAVLKPIAEHDLHFAGQTSSMALCGRYIANPTTQEMRKQISKSLSGEHEAEYIRHASCLTRQGAWTHYNKDVMPFDFSWTNLIYGPGPHVVAFVLNAQLNSLRTPDMLHLWFGLPSAACVLCDSQNCTLHHVLVKCKKALNDGRYTWRHDSVLINIEHALVELVAAANKRKIVNAHEAIKKAFKPSFVRAGEKRDGPAPRRDHPGLLGCANDWKLLVDFDHRQYVFPPSICATSERPDVVLWSVRARMVILLELTVPAEEGMHAAQVRKEAKYAKLLDSIAASNFWKPRLWTLEVGARGLVSSRTFRTFTTIGFSVQQAKQLCKSVSEVAARCSFAIYLAHKQNAWIRSELVDFAATKAVKEAESDVKQKPVQIVQVRGRKETNVTVLRNNGISVLYHFTDAANLESIKKHGLLSASSLSEKSLPAVLNSDESSRAKDKQMKLEKFVRLSFNDENPMKYIAKQEKRVSNAVMLQIKLEVVSRPGVVFFDCNATHHEAVGSTSPAVVHFDVVKAANQFAVAEGLRRFYQAEVLVPSPLPPHLIVFPDESKDPVLQCKSSGVGASCKVESVEQKVQSVSSRSKPKLSGMERCVKFGDSGEPSPPERESERVTPSLDDDILSVLGDASERSSVDDSSLSQLPSYKLSGASSSPGFVGEVKSAVPLPVLPSVPVSAPASAPEVPQFRVSDVEKIIGKRREGKKVEYRVVWKGLLDQTWENLASLHACKKLLNAFEQSDFPPACAKKDGDSACSCGDTGCEGPPETVYHATSSSVPSVLPTVPAVSSSSPLPTVPASSLLPTVPVPASSLLPTVPVSSSTTITGVPSAMGSSSFLPLADRKHICAKCASLGPRCHCFDVNRLSTPTAATRANKMPLGGPGKQRKLTR